MKFQRIYELSGLIAANLYRVHIDRQRKNASKILEWQESSCDKSHRTTEYHGKHVFFVEGLWSPGKMSFHAYKRQ